LSEAFAADAIREILEGFAPECLPASILSAARRKLKYPDAVVKLHDLQPRFGQ
jgi:hypothetical protein